MESETKDGAEGGAAVGCSAWLGGAFLPWNHPLRKEAEQMVQRWNDYAQTHLPSDNKRELAEMVLEFLRTHQPPNEPS